jgi:hypothetical protein
MKFIKLVSAAFALLSLAACQSYWDAHPDLGSSVNSAIQAQKVNPVAPEGNQKPTKGLDGPAAKASVDSYQRSFESKGSSSTYPGGGALSPSSGSSSGINTMNTTTK